jgi:transcription elongation factor GreA
MKYQLVESIEADPSTGRISAESPLGRSLLGRRVDEEVSWTAGFKSMQMQLVHIA